MRRVDARFVLPKHPTTVALLGSVDGWRQPLAAAGIAEVTTGDAPDVVVSDAAHAEEALAADAAMVLVEGALPRRAARAAGYELQRYLVLPDVARPEMVIPADHPAARRHALAYRGARRPPLRRLLFQMKGVAAAAAPTRVWTSAALTLASRIGTTPAVLEVAGDLGLPPDASWYLVLGSYSSLPKARFAFLAGEGARSDPRWAIKVSRVRDASAPFDRDEVGVALLAEAAPGCAGVVPRILGRTSVDNHPISLETAAIGPRLADLLRRDGTDAWPLVAPVAGWLIQLATESAQPAGTLRAKAAELAAALDPWLAPAQRDDVMRHLGDVPSVLAHGDPGCWNIICTRDGFRVMDWETASRPAPPLFDLIYLLGDACTTMLRRPQHPDELTALFAGRSGQSARVFEQVGAAAAALGLTDSQVGALATFVWLRQATVGLRQYGDDHHLVRFAHRWLDDPDLGVTWAAWRRWSTASSRG